MRFILALALTCLLPATGWAQGSQPVCVRDAPVNGPHRQLCLQATPSGAVISYNPINGAPPLPVSCNINGSVVNNCLSGGGGIREVVDPRNHGAVCGTSDSTAGLQAAVNAALVTGGTVQIPCPLTVAGQVNIGASGMQGGIRITGTGPMYMPAQNVNPNGPAAGGSGTLTWPPGTGSAIVCTSTGAAACLMVNASGVEIDHINFGNIQPPPPATGTTWTPTFYPWIIGTQSNTGWQGLNIHDVTFTSTSQAIDLEGTSDYTTWSGTQVTLDHIWCNACLNTGVRIHNIDNQQFYSRFMFVPSGYYMGSAALGNYLRQNAVGFDIQYSAAPQFNDLNFFSLKSAIQLRNGSVTNNFGQLTFAVSALQITNVMFNNVCQAMTMPNGNGTWLNFGKLVNVDVWGDQSGFLCSAGKAMFDLPSNFVDISLSHVDVYDSDTFMNIGCGTPGTGACPAGGGSGQARARIYDLDTLLGYGNWTAGAPLISAPSSASVFMVTDMSALAPSAGAGAVFGPGLDGTQTYQSQFFIGGGANGAEGAASLQGGGSLAAESGFTSFWTPDHIEQGWVGGCVEGSSAGCSFTATTGAIYLKPNSGSSVMSFRSSGTTSLINLGNLPISCTGLPTGTLWDDSSVIKACP